MKEIALGGMGWAFLNPTVVMGVTANQHPEKRSGDVTWPVNQTSKWLL